jgi:acetyl-CoA carboxylase biotin carboxyl carrier protein
MAEHKGAMHVDTALVRQLAELLDETNLSEIEVADRDRRVRVARTITSVIATAPASATSSATAVAPAAAQPATAAGPDLTNALKSPMVGTVYICPEPGAKPFVAAGDKVKEGQTILIIEAMKVMNTIAAARSGTVQAVLIENGQPVEYDQPLIVIS